jgi:urease accessory protein UreF
MSEKVTALKGRDAALVLDNPAYKEAHALLKNVVMEQWKACPIRDREGQVLLLQLAKLTDKFEAILTGMVENGKMAQHKIDMDNLRDETQTRRFFRKVTG